MSQYSAIGLENTNPCSICGRDYTGLGNNARPVNDGRCCDECNTIVVYRRINDQLRARKAKPAPAEAK